MRTRTKLQWKKMEVKNSFKYALATAHDLDGHCAHSLAYHITNRALFRAPYFILLRAARRGGGGAEQ